MLFAGVILSGVTIVLSIAYSTYRTCFYSPKDRVEDPYSPLDGDQYQQVGDLIRKCTAITEKKPFRWMKTTAKDKTPLYARYYMKSEKAPLMILFHGYRGSALRDCSGGFILADRLGFNVLAVDQRGHGRSGGKTISFGILERYDCLAWAQFASEQLSPGRPIILYGLSMGAATILMASELSMPEEVVCVLADCPYSSAKDIIKKVCRDRSLPPTLTYPFVRLGAKIFGRFDPSAASPVSAIANARLPILLYHGEDDRFVPCQMSRAICQANAKRCVLHTFPVAGHGLSYIADPIAYEKATSDFLSDIHSLKPWLKR